MAIWELMRDDKHRVCCKSRNVRFANNSQLFQAGNLFRNAEFIIAGNCFAFYNRAFSRGFHMRRCPGILRLPDIAMFTITPAIKQISCRQMKRCCDPGWQRFLPCSSGVRQQFVVQQEYLSRSHNYLLLLQEQALAMGCRQYSFKLRT